MSNGQIFQLIPKVMSEISAVGKEGVNTNQKYKFRAIDDVMNAAHPVFARNGVFCAPEVIEKESQDRLSASGATIIRVLLTVRHTFFAGDGSSIPVVTVDEKIDSGDKASNKAMTAAYKYALCELLCIPTKDIAEGDLDSPDAGTDIRPNGKNAVPVLEEDIPLDQPTTPPEECITQKEVERLEIRFREELRPEIQKEAKKYLHDFLGIRFYLDEHGNPSAKAIPKAKYAEFGKMAMAHARSL